MKLVGYIKLLSPLIIVIYLDNIIDNILKGLDNQTGVMFCNIADLLITIFFIIILLPKYGISGYIVVLYISEIFNFIVSLSQLYKTIPFKLNYISLLFIPILACIFAYYFSFNIHIKNIFLGLLFFLFAYTLFIIAFDKNIIPKLNK